jgi:anti-anti-sigma factor
MDELRIDEAPGTVEGVRLLRLTGPFTVTTLFAFQEIVRRDPGPITIIDLSGVPYMDSAALGTLLGVHVSCQRHDRKYSLIGIPPRIDSLIRMCRVDDILVSHATLAEAESSLNRQPASGPSW